MFLCMHLSHMNVGDDLKTICICVYLYFLRKCQMLNGLLLDNLNRLKLPQFFFFQISKKLCKLNVLTLKCDFGVLHTLTKYITSFNYEVLWIFLILLRHVLVFKCSTSYLSDNFGLHVWWSLCKWLYFIRPL